METNLTKIGNSKGIRIPAHLIKQYGFDKGVEIIPEEKGITIKPREQKKPRQGWDEASNEMLARGETLLDDESKEWLEFDIDVGIEHWEIEDESK